MLIKKWVSYYENDIIKLLKALDVEEKVDLCVEIVDEILKEVHIDTAVGCLISVMVDNGEESPNSGSMPVIDNLPMLQSFMFIFLIVNYFL